MEEQKQLSSFLDRFIEVTNEIELKNILTHYFIVLGKKDIDIFLHQFFAKCVEVGVQDSSMLAKFQQFFSMQFDLNLTKKMLSLITIANIFSNYHKEYPQTMFYILDQIQNKLYKGYLVKKKQLFQFNPQPIAIESHHIKNYFKTILFFSNFCQSSSIKDCYDDISNQFNKKYFNILQNKQNQHQEINTVYDYYHRHIFKLGNYIARKFKEEIDLKNDEKSYLQDLEYFQLRKTKRNKTQEEIKELIAKDYELIDVYHPNTHITNKEIKKQQFPIIFGLMRQYFNNLCLQFGELESNEFNEILDQYQQVIFENSTQIVIPKNNLSEQNWVITKDYFNDDDKQYDNQIKFFCFDSIEKIKNQEKILIICSQSTDICFIVNVIENNEKFYFVLPDSSNSIQKNIFQISLDQLGVIDNLENLLLIVNYIQCEINSFSNKEIITSDSLDKIELRNKYDVFGKIELELLMELQKELRSDSGELLLGQEFLQIKIFDQIYDAVVSNGEIYHKGKKLKHNEYDVVRDYLHECVVRYYNKNKEILTDETLKNIEKLIENKIFFFRSDKIILFDYHQYSVELFPNLKKQITAELIKKIENLKQLASSKEENEKKYDFLQLKKEKMKEKIDFLNINELTKIFQQSNFMHVFFYEQPENVIIKHLQQQQEQDTLPYDYFYEQSQLKNVIGNNLETISSINKSIYFYYFNLLDQDRERNSVEQNNEYLIKKISELQIEKLKQELFNIKTKLFNLYVIYNNPNQQYFSFESIRDESIKLRIQAIMEYQIIGGLTDKQNGICLVNDLILKSILNRPDMFEIIKHLNRLMYQKQYEEIDNIFTDLFFYLVSLLSYFVDKKQGIDIPFSELFNEVIDDQVSNLENYFLCMYFVLENILNQIMIKVQQVFLKQKENNYLDYAELEELKDTVKKTLDKLKPKEDNIYDLFLDNDQKLLIKLKNIPYEFTEMDGHSFRIVKQFNQLFMDPSEYEIPLQLTSLEKEQIKEIILLNYGTTQKKMEQENEHGKDNEIKRQFKNTKMIEWNLKQWCADAKLFDNIHKKILDSNKVEIFSYSPFNFIDTKNQEMNIILIKKQDTEFLCRLLENNKQFQQSLFLRFQTQNQNQLSEEDQQKLFWFMNKYQFFNIVTRNLKAKNNDLKQLFSEIKKMFDQDDIRVNSHSNFLDNSPYNSPYQENWEGCEYLLFLILMVIKHENVEKATQLEFNKLPEFNQTFLLSNTDKKLKKITDQINFKANNSKLMKILN
ncbi:hypothetical protein ABPG72_008164 [Tetrahymena utriculariae]